MRTFWIILSTVVVTLLIVAGGGLILRNAWFDVPISAEVSEWGHLDITSHSPQPVYIFGVAFNDRRRNECATQPGWVFFKKVYTGFDQYNNKWSNWWRVSDAVTLDEGDSVTAQFDRRRCGDQIVKAVIFTNLGTYTFTYPRSPHGIAPNRVMLSPSWW
jgi:hypothetical protein